MGGEYLLKLNISLRPIAYKYREGKLQRTLKRELKEPETGNGEGFGRSAVNAASPYLGIGSVRLERISFAFMCRECVWVGVLR